MLQWWRGNAAIRCWKRSQTKWLRIKIAHQKSCDLKLKYKKETHHVYATDLKSNLKRCRKIDIKIKITVATKHRANLSERCAVLYCINLLTRSTRSMRARCCLQCFRDKLLVILSSDKVLVTVIGDKPLLTLFYNKVCRTKHFSAIVVDIRKLT